MCQTRKKEIKRTNINLAYDGERITSYCYGSLARANKILLFCHGFPGTNRLPDLASRLEKESIAVVEINYRGDKESEGKFSFIGSIADIMTVADHLKKYYSEKPLYVLGYSMGGFYTANLIEFKPDIFDKVILLNPVVDTKALFSNKVIMEDLWACAKNMLSLAKPGMYEQEINIMNGKLNPISFAFKLRALFSVVQSTHDEIVSPKIARKFFSLICGERYFEIPNGKHDVRGDEKELIQAIIE